MSETNFSETALAEITFLLRPLKYIDSTDKAISLFAKLGYTLPETDITAAFTDAVAKADALITATNTLLEAGSSIDKLTAIAEMILACKDAIDKVNSLVTELRSVPDLASDFINNAPLDELPVRLLDYLLFTGMYKRHPQLFSILYMLGIFEQEARAEDASVYQPACNLKVVRWERIPRYFSEPGTVLDEVYDWTTDFNTDIFLERFELLMHALVLPGGLYKQSENVKNALGNITDGLTELRVPVFSTGIYPDTFAQFGLNLTPAEAQSGKLKGIALIPYLIGTTGFDFDIGEKWEVSLDTSVSLDAGAGIVIRPPFSLEVFENIFSSPADTASLNLTLRIGQKEEADPLYLFGTADGSHLSMEGISLTVYAKSDSGSQDFGADLDIEKIELVVNVDEADGFLKTLLPEGISASVGIGLGFSLLNGFYIKGSGSISISLPTHIQLGPVEIENITVSVIPEGSEIPIELSATFTLTLGPFTGVVENIGLKPTISFPEDKSGNLGPLNATMAFKWPTGLGLSIDAQGFKGGGFLFIDQEKGEYSGGLELEFQDTIGLRIIGILNTIMPDGSDGFSLILIITAEFTPIQLGFGFTLNGVGGLIGINRTVTLDVLQAGVKDGTLNSILFPEDIVANASRIVSDIQKVFPVYKEQYVFGPMAEIGWGSPTLITVQLGLIIELPDPVRLAILGVLKALLPDEDTALLKLQVNFLGAIDFDKKALSFDASIYDSKLLSFTLTGDMALRLNWGSDPVFLLSVGGFHPSYQPPANLGLGDMERLGINLFSGNNPRLRIETYFAVTSNTVQFGANGELYVGVAGFDVDGSIGFDVLFQFSPFYFIATCHASLCVSYEGEDLLSVSLKLSLDGPTPWHARGDATFSVLCFDVTVSIDKTFGDSSNATYEPIDVMPLLKEALQNTANWTAKMPEGSNLQVTLKSIDLSDGIIVVHPCGELSISQKVVPLGLTIEKFGNQSIEGDNTFSISRITIGDSEAEFSAISEEFAKAQFVKMTDAEKLSQKDFEPLRSGADLSALGDANASYVLTREFEYELSYLPEKRTLQPWILQRGLFDELLKGNAIGKSALSNVKNQPSVLGTQAVKIGREQFVIANTSDLKLFATDCVFNSESEAIAKYREITGSNRKLAKNIQVIPSYAINI